MKDFFAKTSDDVLKAFESDAKKGLTSKQAAEHLQKYGENKLEGKKPRSIFLMFLDQFKDFLVIILIVAAIVSVIVSGGHFLDGSIIMGIVVLNAILGVTQESRANNALKALKEMSSPMAKVVRNGVVDKIASNQIVPGDILMLEAGDYVPTDMRLIETVNLKIDEAALTGESVPSEKRAEAILAADAGIGDRINSAFMGTVVTYGRGIGVAAETGMDTQMGKIATMLTDTEEEVTPLQKKLDDLGKLLGIVCLAVCAAIFVLGLWRGGDLLEMFMTAVALAVAAIPEGLTVVVTVILAMGMQKMVKSNAIIKRLSAVETLGSTTVICSDKTGTLTQNKMTVVKLFDGKQNYEVTGTGYGSEGSILLNEQPAQSKGLGKLLQGAALCNDAIYKQEESRIIGDPTEGALLVAAQKYGIEDESTRETFPRLQEIPFDSDRKLMSTFHSIDSVTVMYTKGAPDEVLRRSVASYENGEIVPMTDTIRETISAQNNEYAENALRVLAVAYRPMDEIKGLDSESQERDLIFLGLLGMIDPPRDEVRDAIAVCKTAGIGVKMITGDHKTTASAIAADIGIVTDGALEGRELNDMSDEQLREAVKHISVFARVSPEHKVRLVDAVRANGNIAAMTGDGVNDAPSLKRADIGVAMGITGTDVSKEAADMILTDDNFASIVKAVEQGRTIYDNIRKVVGYLLSCNIGEILLIFAAMLIGWDSPLKAIQLLSINLITDAFPAFALGMEEAEEGVMKQKPRDPKESIINKKMGVAVGVQSAFLAAGALAAYAISLKVLGHSEIEASTMCFVTLVMGELLRAYSARSEHRSIFKMQPLSNSFLNKTVIFSFIFMAVVVYVPFMQPVFKTVALPPAMLGLSAIMAFLPLLGGEVAKFITERMK